MKVFILEDSAERIAWFESKMAHCELIVSRTVEAGLAQFEGLRPDWVFLDHDLDLSHLGGDYVEHMHSGCAFLNRVLCSETRFPGLRKADKVIIHSVNPDGALAMCLALTTATIEWERIPFPSLQQRMSVS